MADDHAPAPRPEVDREFDIETDEGLTAYVEDLYRRKGVPERLRYPETPEEYERMTREAMAQIDRGEFYSLEEVRARFAEKIAAARRG